MTALQSALTLLLIAAGGSPVPSQSAMAVAEAPAVAMQTRPIEMVTAGPTPLRVTGTLQTYDADAKLVAVATTNGSLRLFVTRDSRIRQSGHVVDAAQLRARIGSKVVVRYVEADRGRVVVSLTVLGRSSDAPN